MNPCKNCPHNECCDLALDYHPTKECTARTNEKKLIKSLEDICAHVKSIKSNSPHTATIELLAVEALRLVGVKEDA